MDERKTVDIDDFKKENRRRRIKEGVDKYVVTPAKIVGQFAVENPVAALSAVAAVIPIAGKFIRYRQTKAEDRRRAIDFYDTRRGRHVKIRRPLTRREQIEVDRRYENRESYTSIFNDMGLLK